MKKLLYSIIISTLIVSNGYAQDFSLKYGKVTPQEVSMTTYDKDTTANAFVIYQTRDTYYEYIDNDFRVISNYETKIKIINQDGTDYATVQIPLYHPEKQSLRKESISRLEAYAYNLEGGKVVKTKMDKNYIYEERISSYWKQVKFSVPAVKAGTVIEFRYRIASDYDTDINDWVIQRDIPVHFSQLEVKIPEYYKFSFDSKGYEKMDVKDIPETQNFTINFGGGQREMVQCNSRKLIFTSQDVPALKKDEYIWCIDDFKSLVTFELNSFQIPGHLYKPFSRTWTDLEKTLKESESWGSYLSLRNPYKEEMKKLSLDTMSNEEKIKAIFQLAKSNIAWNEEYGFSGNNTRKAIKEGRGTNAEINFVILSMLKDAGITAYPIVLSRRDRGRLPLSYPSLNKINTFIIGALEDDSKMVYLDGSVKSGSINILPPVLMVDRARLIDPKGNGQWVDLTNVGKHSIRVLITSSIDENKKLSGKRQTLYDGIYAISYKNMFSHDKDSIETVQEIETKEGISIDNYGQSGMDKFSSQAKEMFDFTKEINQTNEFIYINPMIFPHITKNSFIEEERKLPVEFSFPYEFRLSSSIVIPEGYQLEEIPQPIKFSTEDGGITCMYNSQQAGNQIVLNYILQFNRVIFSQLEYSSLKLFWEKLVEKNTEQIVFKKNL